LIVFAGVPTMVAISNPHFATLSPVFGQQHSALELS
jgi:hypothetical protein